MLPPLIFARNGPKNEDAKCGGYYTKCCAQENILRKVASEVYARVADCNSHHGYEPTKPATMNGEIIDNETIVAACAETVP